MREWRKNDVKITGVWASQALYAHLNDGDEKLDFAVEAMTGSDAPFVER